jgi:hypothetical protein
LPSLRSPRAPVHTQPTQSTHSIAQSARCRMTPRAERGVRVQAARVAWENNNNGNREHDAASPYHVPWCQAPLSAPAPGYAHSADRPGAASNASADAWLSLAVGAMTACARPAEEDSGAHTVQARGGQAGEGRRARCVWRAGWERTRERRAPDPATPQRRGVPRRCLTQRPDRTAQDAAPARTTGCYTGAESRTGGKEERR